MRAIVFPGESIIIHRPQSTMNLSETVEIPAISQVYSPAPEPSGRYRPLEAWPGFQHQTIDIPVGHIIMKEPTVTAAKPLAYCSCDGGASAHSLLAVDDDGADFFVPLPDKLPDAFGVILVHKHDFGGQLEIWDGHGDRKSVV